MQAQYSIDTEDYIAFNMSYTQSDPTMQKRIRMSQLSGAAAILVIGGIFLYIKRDFSAVLMLCFVIAAALYAVYIPRSIKKNIKKSVSRVLKNSAKTACGEKTLALEDTEIHLTGSGEDSRYEYSRVLRVVTDTQHYFIYLGAMEALILPFRAFADEAQRQAFYSSLCDKIIAAGGRVG